MSCRNARNSLVVALVLSTGAFSIPHAEAAQSRSGRGPAAAAIQEELSARTLLQSIVKFLRFVAAPYDGPPGQKPGNGDVDPSREGSGLCPNGRPRGLQPGNGGGY
jgi:hypothetical protein